jgi:hypothetical protein
VASDAGNVNTSNNIAIVIAGCALRSVVIDQMICSSADNGFASKSHHLLPWRFRNNESQ